MKDMGHDDDDDAYVVDIRLTCHIQAFQTNQHQLIVMDLMDVIPSIVHLMQLMVLLWHVHLFTIERRYRYNTISQHNMNKIDH
jgi:hypothetical protein